MFLKRKDFGANAYAPIAERTVFTLKPEFSAPSSISAKDNFVARLTTSRPPSSELRSAARDALARMDQRAGESVDEWADQLSRDLGSHHD